MSDRLDSLLARLAAEPPERSLDHLGDDVVRSIKRLRVEARTVSALAPLRLATTGLALAMGVTASSFVAAAAAERTEQLSSFSIMAQLAPSTLLEAPR